MAEAAPEGARDPERLAELAAQALAYKPAQAIARKQRDTGIWGGNLLGPGPNKALGWAEMGTFSHYRQLVEMGWPTEQRVFRIADRVFFRLLSRDPDPALLVEFQRASRTDPGFGLWARNLGREVAAASLARASRGEDPRLRGAAHNILNGISTYLRSPLVEKPFRKTQGKTVVEPEAVPPSVFAVEMLAFLPALQRERSGFVERLGAYFSNPAPKRAFFQLAGKRIVPPMFILMGDPLRADAHGHVPDVPFAVYWLELLARLGLVRQVPSAAKTLARLYSECDDQGIWSPKALRAMPKTESPVLTHYFPLEGAGKSPAQRQTDVTFRLALIARLLGLPIEVL